ncbi:MAG TPA: SDR family NAD(P)-dependent oxidoreductase [Polyangiaceae bacterium]
MAKDNGKIAIVSGANRGLGLETCRELATLGYRVVLSARSLESAQAAVAELERGDSLRIEPATLDVSSEASIASFAEHARAELPRVDVLVNNAGISMQGFDERVVRGTLGTNFFGALRLTEALRPRLSDTANIVMVSSGMGELSSVTRELRTRFSNPALTLPELVGLANAFIEDVAAGRHSARGWPSSAYRVSKICLNALTRIWARDLPAGMRINAICPGWVRTDLGGPGATRSLAQGVKGIVWAATLTAGGPSGGFFRDGKPIAW